MKVYLDCFPCFMRQALEAARMATNDPALPGVTGPTRSSAVPRVQVQGLMTMGPRFGDPELARPYFQETKRLFDQLSKLGIKNVEMRYLSMGMSNTYEIAIEEGANMVRIGTKIFGERDYK